MLCHILLSGTRRLCRVAHTQHAHSTRPGTPRTPHSPTSRTSRTSRSPSVTTLALPHTESHRASNRKLCLHLVIAIVELFYYARHTYTYIQYMLKRFACGCAVHARATPKEIGSVQSRCVRTRIWLRLFSSQVCIQWLSFDTINSNRRINHQTELATVPLNDMAKIVKHVFAYAHTNAQHTHTHTHANIAHK